uniref:NADH-ubiquinone oxidoreductase chain 5 n=1 Tax=Coomaniella copipes TaxID=2936727 RepID=A0A8T9VZL9_9COLE|nr:NADH dehydrogenase subunit 5 [Coomaniella copipes]UPI13478.1 NADH dehydrogenase subunit 5 [Coomaniella copipes]
MISICFIFFLFFLFLSLSFFSMSIYFMSIDLSLILELEMMSLNSNSVFMCILIDWMSLLFMSFVLFISSMVIYYSEEYMSGDIYINRFILLVSMFVLSMMLLIISPNLISILLGWDGLGLVSYCLVIYYQNVKSFNAGMLTALSNRIGDVALLMSIAWMLNYGSWNYVFYLDCMKNDFYMQLISFLVVLAALTKSAQIPFSSWLPAAMAAPTPVSSLVHSSTLVTAGVYLLIRFHSSLGDSLLMFLLFISGMTMFMAGLGANFEFDLKKIIALSTLSQLGLMMSILSLGDSMLAFFHLLTHALFKALLFMCAGCMIHNLNNCQDIRFMGGLINFLPLTCSMFVVSNMALCGLPFLAGFYSKDLILEYSSMSFMNMYMYLVFYVSTGLTVSYTFRLLYYTIFGEFNFYTNFSLSDSGFVMLKGMSGLIFLVIFGGSMLNWLMFPIPYFINLPIILKLMTLFVIFMGMWLGYELSKFALNYQLNSLNWLKISLFSSSMWNMVFISTSGIIPIALKSGIFYHKIIDQGWSEFLGSQNLYKNLSYYSSLSRIFSDNSLKIYLSMLMIWLIYLLFMLF